MRAKNGQIYNIVQMRQYPSTNKKELFYMHYLFQIH